MKTDHKISPCHCLRGELKSADGIITNTLLASSVGPKGFILFCQAVIPVGSNTWQELVDVLVFGEVINLIFF